MTTFGKIAIGTSALGTLGGGAFLANNLLSKPEEKLAPKLQTISEKLIEEGFDTNVEDQLQTILDAYKLVKDTTITFKTLAEEDESLTGLKTKCQVVLSKKGFNKEDYKKARQWCVKTVTVEKVLSNLGYELLVAETSPNPSQDSIWSDKVRDLKLTPNSFPTIGEKIKGTDNSADIKALKEGCLGLKLKEAKTTDKDFNSKLDLGKLWCSKPR